MWLPIPGDRAASEFQQLAKEQFGQKLDEETARDWAMRLLQFHFLKVYAYRHLLSEEDKPSETD